METYKLEQLLNDKELCKQIISRGFTLCDNSGTIGEYDFVSNSMRYNHITAFKNLYSKGGKDLFDKILKSGKTCLCDRPDAAKVGVVEIEGADGFYLKSNVSAIVAFMSILNAIACIEAEDINPCEDVYAAVNSDEDGQQSDSGYEEGWDYDVTEEQPDAYERNFKIVKNDSGYNLFDVDSGEDVIFECAEGSKTYELSVMYDIQPITYKEVVGTVYHQDGTSEDEYEEKTVGYRYRLEKDGNWGFISKHFAHFVYPLYVDIKVNSKGDIAGYYYRDVNDICVSIGHHASYFTLDGFYDSEIVLHDGKSKYDMMASAKDLYLLGCINETFIPDSNFEISCVVEGNSGYGIAYYLPSTGDAVYRHFAVDCIGLSRIDEYYCKYEPGFIKQQLSGHLFSKPKTYMIPVPEFDAKYCSMAVNDKKENSVKCVKYIEQDIYIAQKEGYCAIVKYDYEKEDVKEYITPFAFTDISIINNRCLMLEMFGKKGVFNIEQNKYVIPCEYETITLIYDDSFIVTKAGFKGNITADGKWNNHLHRED